MATYPPQSPPTSSPDPFGDFESVPSLSFATATVGTVYQGVISRLPREVQDRDIQTKKPKFWDDGSPQMSVVLHLDITMPNGAVETRSVWAKKPSSMFRAIGLAQKEAGAQLALGGTLAIRFAGTQPSKTPGFNPQKIYEARYTPPAAHDPWQGTTGAAPQSSASASASSSPIGWPTAPAAPTHGPQLTPMAPAPTTKPTW